jgi:hypothetical protein
MEKKVDQFIRENPTDGLSDLQRNLNFSGAMRMSLHSFAIPDEDVPRALNPPVNPRPIANDLSEDRARATGERYR